jgi:hypothetical protein
MARKRKLTDVDIEGWDSSGYPVLHFAYCAIAVATYIALLLVFS